MTLVLLEGKLLKIDNSVKSTGNPRVNQNETQSGKAPTGANTAPARSGESVNLSDVAAQLQAIEKSLANIGVVDSARVAEVRQAISDGRFKINPEVIADRLLESVNELIRAHKA